jgi:hypothetical protein
MQSELMLARATSAPLINTSLAKGAAQTVSKTGRSKRSVSFRGWLDTPSKHTAILKELCERWRDTGLFPDVCGPTKWRELTYPVYADPFGALFGVVAYSVHMSIYEEIVQENGEKQLRVWDPGFLLVPSPNRREFVLLSSFMM